MTKDFDIERAVHEILFDVMDLTVGQEKELREKFIDFGRRCAKVRGETLSRRGEGMNWNEILRWFLMGFFGGLGFLVVGTLYGLIIKK